MKQYAAYDDGYICPGGSVRAGTSLSSVDGIVELSFSVDGNLRVHNKTSGEIISLVDTVGSSVNGTLSFEENGRLVIRNVVGSVVWSSNTTCDDIKNSDGCILKIQNDGDLAIYNTSGQLIGTTITSNFVNNASDSNANDGYDMCMNDILPYNNTIMTYYVYIANVSSLTNANGSDHCRFDIFGCPVNNEVESILYTSIGGDDISPRFRLD